MFPREPPPDFDGRSEAATPGEALGRLRRVMEPVREFATGVAYLPRGAGMILRRRRLMLLGVAPALVTAVLLLAGLVALVWFADDLVIWATPFADDWGSPWPTVFRVALGAALVIGFSVVGVLLFAAITLTVGGPWYDRIAEEIDQSLGRVARVERPWWQQLGGGLTDSIRLIVLSVLAAIPLLVVGFVPVVGQLVAAVVGATIGGWLLALELVGVPYEIRGMRLADRRRALRARRARALGFGIPVYLLCLVPLLAILVLPIAVAGGTLLARDLTADQASAVGGRAAVPEP